MKKLISILVISVGLAMVLLANLGRVYYERGIESLKNAIGAEEQGQGNNQYELTDEDIVYYVEEVEEAANAWGESIDQMLPRFNIQMSDTEWRIFVASQRAGETVTSFGRLAVILGVVLYLIYRRDIGKKKRRKKPEKEYSERNKGNAFVNDPLFVVAADFPSDTAKKQSINTRMYCDNCKVFYSEGVRYCYCYKCGSKLVRR